MRATLTDRVRARLRALIDAKRIRQIDIAAAMGVSQGAVSAMMKGDHGFRLDYLEAIATLMEVPVAELIIAPDSTLMEVHKDERYLVLTLRDVTPELRQAVHLVVRNLPTNPRHKDVVEFMRHVAERTHAG
jgi:transcriptional regulator with XRE-family HTH domain